MKHLTRNHREHRIFPSSGTKKYLLELRREMNIEKGSEVNSEQGGSEKVA